MVRQGDPGSPPPSPSPRVHVGGAHSADALWSVIRRIETENSAFQPNPKTAVRCWYEGNSVYLSHPVFTHPHLHAGRLLRPVCGCVRAELHVGAEPLVFVNPVFGAGAVRLSILGWAYSCGGCGAEMASWEVSRRTLSTERDRSRTIWPFLEGNEGGLISLDLWDELQRGAVDRSSIDADWLLRNFGIEPPLKSPQQQQQARGVDPGVLLAAETLCELQREVTSAAEILLSFHGRPPHERSVPPEAERRQNWSASSDAMSRTENLSASADAMSRTENPSASVAEAKENLSASAAEARNLSAASAAKAASNWKPADLTAPTSKTAPPTMSTTTSAVQGIRAVSPASVVPNMDDVSSETRPKMGAVSTKTAAPAKMEDISTKTAAKMETVSPMTAAATEPAAALLSSRLRAAIEEQLGAERRRKLTAEGQQVQRQPLAAHAERKRKTTTITTTAGQAVQGKPERAMLEEDFAEHQASSGAGGPKRPRHATASGVADGGRAAATVVAVSTTSPRLCERCGKPWKGHHVGRPQRCDDGALAEDMERAYGR